MLKKIGKFIVYFILALVLLVALLFAIGSKHENDTKKSLANELINLPPPPGCSESGRQYQRGGIDTVSTWIVDYSCNTTVKEAYDFIITNLSERGYQSNKDYLKNGSSYNFDYSSNSFTADYRFGSDNESVNTPHQKDLFEQSPVSQIHLQLIRGNDPYGR